MSEVSIIYWDNFIPQSLTVLASVMTRDCHTISHLIGAAPGYIGFEEGWYVHSFYAHEDIHYDCIVIGQLTAVQ